MVNHLLSILDWPLQWLGYSRYRITDSATGAFLGRPDSAAGVSVTEDDCLSLSAIFAGVMLYANVTSTLPLNVYTRRPDGSKSIATARIHWLLHSQPNPEMTASTLRTIWEVSRLIWGNAYGEIVWGDDAQAESIWPIEPWRVRPDRNDAGELIYVVDGNRELAAADVLHVPQLSFDGVCGRGFLYYAADSLGGAIAAQRFAASFFANSAQPGGILMHPGSPDPDARKALKKSWNEDHNVAAGKANRTAIVWGGWEYVPQAGSMEPGKAQLLETRRFGNEEAARWLNLPPFLLRDLTKGTFSSSEEENQSFLTYSLGPVLVRYEQEYDRKLLLPPALYSKHKVEGLLRGNMAARSAFYRELFMVGGITINRILELEDENTIGAMGEVRFVPANMMPLAAAIRQGTPADPQQQPPPAPGPAEPPKPESAPPMPHDAPAEKPTTGSSDAAAATGDVQATALNGAQITSLVAVIQAVASDLLPAETAKSVIVGSFPLMDKSLIDSMIDPIAAWKKDRPAPAPGVQPSQPNAKPALRALLVDTLARMNRKEVAAARRAVKEPGKLLAWLDTFYGDHRPLLAQALLPVLQFAAASGWSGNPLLRSQTTAAAIVNQGREILLDVAGRATARNLAEEAEKHLAVWEMGGANHWADRIIGEIYAEA